MLLKTTMPVIDKETGEEGVVLATHTYIDHPEEGQYASVRFPSESKWMREDELLPVPAAVPTAV